MTGTHISYFSNAGVSNEDLAASKQHPEIVTVLPPNQNPPDPSTIPPASVVVVQQKPPGAILPSGDDTGAISVSVDETGAISAPADKTGAISASADDTGAISASADGAWQKRGSGRAYNSLSGNKDLNSVNVSSTIVNH